MTTSISMDDMNDINDSDSGSSENEKETGLFSCCKRKKKKDNDEDGSATKTLDSTMFTTSIDPNKCLTIVKKDVKYMKIIFFWSYFTGILELYNILTKNIV